jgi:hypothetical protein
VRRSGSKATQEFMTRPACERPIERDFAAIASQAGSGPHPGLAAAATLM